MGKRSEGKFPSNFVLLTNKYLRRSWASFVIRSAEESDGDSSLSLPIPQYQSPQRSAAARPLLTPMGTKRNSTRAEDAGKSAKEVLTKTDTPSSNTESLLPRQIVQKTTKTKQ